MTTPWKTHCSNPDCPHERVLFLSKWIKENLPESKAGWLVHDVDKVLYNTVSRKMLFLESKTNNCTPERWQQRIIDNINFIMTRGAAFMPQPFTFVGYPKIRFEHYRFNDGKVYFEGKEVTELGLADELTNLLK